MKVSARNLNRSMAFALAILGEALAVWIFLSDDSGRFTMGMMLASTLATVSFLGLIYLLIDKILITSGFVRRRPFLSGILMVLVYGYAFLVTVTTTNSTQEAAGVELLLDRAISFLLVTFVMPLGAALWLAAIAVPGVIVFGLGLGWVLKKVELQ